MEQGHQKDGAGARVRSSDWLARIKEIDAVVAPLLKEKNDLEKKVIESKSHLSPGDVIEWKRGQGKAIGRVIEVRELCGDPMWIVVRIKADGSDGGKSKLYKWDSPMRANIEAEPRAQQNNESKGN